MARAEVQTPGDPSPPQIPSPVTALNNTDSSPERVAAEREALINSRAAAAMVESGDLTGLQKIVDAAQAALAAAQAPDAVTDDGIAVDLTEFGPDVLGVSVPVLRTSPVVAKYGRELPWPAGTPLDKDKKPCQDGEAPAYVVGNLETRDGWLVSRAVPLAS